MARGVVGRDTGVFAPRLTADRSEQRAVKPPFVSADRSEQRAAGPTKIVKKTRIDPNVIPKTYEEAEIAITDAKAKKIVEDIILTSTPPKTSGGGVVSNPYTNAIRILEKQISSGKYGTSFADSIKILQDQIDSGSYAQPFNRLSTQLGTTGLAAGQDIDAASLAAIAGLSSREPMSQYTYSPFTAQIPQTALSDYLGSIGAGTNEVDANRNFLQSMINSENAQMQQYTGSVNQAQNAQRDAAIQAVYGNQAYSQSQLGAAQQAQEFAIKAASEAELKKLTDQILGFTTDEATSKAEDLKRLQDLILQNTILGGKKSSKKKSGKK